MRSFSSRETRKLGECLARRILSKSKQGSAAVVALSGPLGAGKTTFIRGFFKGLGLKKRAASPTFIVIRRVGLKKKRFRNIFHVDAYRLKRTSDVFKLGFKNIISDPKNIILVEWADRIKGAIPRGAKWIRFAHGKKQNERILKIS